MSLESAQLELGRDGAELTSQAVDRSALAAREQILADQPRDVAGVRPFGIAGLRSFLEPSAAIGCKPRLTAAVLDQAA
jgi:hypothetical protein